MTIRLLAAALVLVAAATSVHAQPDAPKPGPEHERLKEMVGEYEVTVKFGGMESKARAAYKLDLGGFILTEEFDGEFGGMKFKGRGQMGYCPVRKKYFNFWADSMSPSPVLMLGDYDKDTKTLTSTGEGPGMDGKTMGKYKSVVKEIDKNTVDFKMYMVQDGKDVEAFHMIYKRKK